MSDVEKGRGLSSASEKTSLLSARDAYDSNDVEASKRYHNQQQHSQSQSQSLQEKESHNAMGDFIKSIVYGGLDGIITTFATVTSVAGASLSPLVIIVLGVSHLVADGLSMGTGDAMSSQAELDLAKSERRRERWEMQNNPEGEIDEMIEIYTSKGVKRSDAESIIRTMAKYPTMFLDHMMSEELGMAPVQHQEEESPVKSGLITMASFMIFGSIPLMPYLVALIPFFSKFLTDKIQLWSSIVMTIVTLFTLGVVKGKVSGGIKSIWWSGCQMALNGTFAAVLGYIVGYLLGKAVHVDEQNLPADAG